MSEKETRNNVADEKNDIKKNVLNKIKETGENKLVPLSRTSLGSDSNHH